MGERTRFTEIEDPEERAGDFLKRSLSSHFRTGPVIGLLKENNSDFKDRFISAKTPFEVLAAVSVSRSEEVIELVDEFVDKWVHGGNTKNPTMTRQLIASAHEDWVASTREK